MSVNSSIAKMAAMGKSSRITLITSPRPNLAQSYHLQAQEQQSAQMSAPGSLPGLENLAAATSPSGWRSKYSRHTTILS